MTDTCRGITTSMPGYGDGQCNEFGEGFAEGLGDIDICGQGGGYGYCCGADSGDGYGLGDGAGRGACDFLAEGYPEVGGPGFVTNSTNGLCATHGEIVFVSNKVVVATYFRRQREYFFTREEAEAEFAVRLLGDSQ